VIDQSVSDPALLERYEELRAIALGTAPAMPRGRGLALLMRSGMAAWLRAWSSLPSSHSRERIVERAARLPATAERPEVVTMLTEMVLSAAREVRA
jgi:hypothetical protein